MHCVCVCQRAVHANTALLPCSRTPLPTALNNNPSGGESEEEGVEEQRQTVIEAHISRSNGGSRGTE